MLPQPAKPSRRYYRVVFGRPFRPRLHPPSRADASSGQTVILDAIFITNQIVKEQFDRLIVGRLPHDS